MSQRELKRVEVLSRVKARTLALRSAAVVLGVSYRQVKRLWARYRHEGAKGLRHRSVGRRSNRGRTAAVRTRALALIRQKYSGDAHRRFGPTLAAEHLASEDGLVIDHETLRRWMLEAGLWSRTRKRSPYRHRRERMAHAGELVQLDGSVHAWFEDRAPAQCLVTLVDDATSRTLGRFSAQETIWAAVAVLRRWIEQYGIPRALYTDWKNVYVRAATAADVAAGEVPYTQFGRMCQTLGIAIIPASSPQAKGRIERNHGTHQDRLVKKLRRLGLQDLATANAFLERTYWAEHNQRFTQPPTSPEDFHRRCPTARQLDHVFHLETRRTVGADWVVRYQNRALQLARQSDQAPARSHVLVCEWPDGHLEITYRDHRVKWTEIGSPATAPVSRPASRPRPAPAATQRPRRSPADHPWRQSLTTFRPNKTLWQAMES